MKTLAARRTGVLIVLIISTEIRIERLDQRRNSHHSKTTNMIIAEERLSSITEDIKGRHVTPDKLLCRNITNSHMHAGLHSQIAILGKCNRV